jgi:hypothetical protein
MTGVARERHWIPERLVTDGGAATCRWVDANGLRYDDPFFASTADRCRAAGTRSSPVDALHTQAAAAPPLPPVAFIFHVSRCGSTLLAQLLGLDERSIVLSEAPLLDEILRSDRPDRDALFDAALHLLGRPRFGEERLFVKTDCWHLFEAAALRRRYPEAPFVLLYRAPAGVLASQRRMRGMHVVPGLLTRVAFEVAFDADRMTLDHYAARVLEQHYRAMLALAERDDNTLLVAYEEGFPDLFLRAAAWLGLSGNEEHLARVRERCRYHGKRPQEAFGADAPAALSDLDLEPLDALYAELEQRRCV